MSLAALAKKWSTSHRLSLGLTSYLAPRCGVVGWRPALSLGPSGGMAGWRLGVRLSL